ncbi:PepSY domain-containing protein [Albidovulum sp.]|uniref:PepSY domain-containing protein n=1 Tax=Albidovulum sp. TaxID=1872424 RepID=UPI001D476BFE|nr:PepSY domain-containing protein [Paracoccaceae bacterium]HPE25311.1 PepSY domain-containing protein [Albidovulum sp.]MCB2121332.1 PepSY domain-containing protein [Paracoccaceae bacterium]MCB2131521.1 PepSY domain-containing protein [Paracoccaceae bacterium]MCB2138438.1 PepSY domain-containing protein [Paracoccaceae bacterium]
MKKIILAAALALSGLSLPVHASSEIDTATQAKVTEQLTAQGYEVRRIDSEDGMIEVYAMKDGKKVELYLNEALEIVKSKEAS